MLVVGLTGGIATGKSTFSALLAARGVPVLDADLLARDAVRPGTRALAQIARAFGPAVLAPDGTLDRAALAARVFADPAQRAALNAIVHPAVRRALLWGVLRLWARGAPLCVLDVPLLLEGPLWRLVARVVLVYCPPETQLARLAARDGTGLDAARARIAAQLPIDAKLPFADDVVDNAGDARALAAQADALAARLRRAARGWWVCWVCPPAGVLCAAWVLLRRNVRWGRRAPGAEGLEAKRA